MRPLQISCLVCTVVLTIIVWNTDGKTRIRVVITLAVCLFIAVLLANLMNKIRLSFARIGNSAHNLAHGYATTNQLQNLEQNHNVHELFTQIHELQIKIAEQERGRKEVENTMKMQVGHERI